VYRGGCPRHCPRIPFTSDRLTPSKKSPRVLSLQYVAELSYVRSRNFCLSDTASSFQMYRLGKGNDTSDRMATRHEAEHTDRASALHTLTCHFSDPEGQLLLSPAFACIASCLSLHLCPWTIMIVIDGPSTTPAPARHAMLGFSVHRFGHDGGPRRGVSMNQDQVN